MPFDDLKQITDFQLDEKLYSFLDVIITGKFYTLFSILFAVGFYVQYEKNKEDSINFLKTYRRRLFFLLLIGFLHSLIWFGDILLVYSIFGFILILFRNVKSKNLILWSIFFLLFPLLIDLCLLPFSEALSSASPDKTAALAHVQYPDMTVEAVISTFQNGSIVDLFFLNIHNLVWKYLGYIPSGGYFKFLGIFLLGYYFASIELFTKKTKSSLLITSLIVGLLATFSAKIIGGSSYMFPSTPLNMLYKFLVLAGQIFMCIFYITSISKVVQTSIGKKAFGYLIPVGRMALSNYLFQTIIMIIIFYNFGFNLIGKIGLLHTSGIAILILVIQIILSHIWLRHFKFGPLEWIWRSLTYKKRIDIRYPNNYSAK
ncbi:DUF418 domain-containing protein [Zobellia laminariae]|uniref:DUF418 domain-containing protein n=1 Tax=Zobellia laminariae TaxID=248906 RepID=UPI0026F4675A|nr:DUF418 domain-containing protein [Zobellia laminariae]WKX76284.1 DUF418 domain-containing protein [Zobellia laminariae]